MLARMSHHAQHGQHGHHSHRPSQGGRSRLYSGGHILKVLLLNSVLFLACGAFAGMIAGDYLSGPMQFRVIAAFILVPLGIAVVSTVAHLWAHKWTAMDDMSERMFGGKPGPE